MPTGVLALLIGTITFFIPKLSFDLSFSSILFIEYLIFSTISTIFTVIFLIRAYWSYEYQYLASPNKYIQLYDDLIVYYQGKSDNNVSLSSYNKFQEKLAVKYSEAATYNQERNNQKTEILHNANNSLVWVLVFVFIDAIIFYSKHYINY